MDNKGKEGSLKSIFFIMILSLVIAFLWPNLSWISGPIHFVLDPTLGFLINLNITTGMFTIVFIIALITTLAQKYTTDQETIKDLKRQQKEINKKAKEFAHDKEKMMMIQKELFPISGKLIKLSMRPLMFTGIPFILLFRWFMDFFVELGNPKILGFMSWFWFYLIFVMVFSSILRKVLKVA